MALNIQQLRVDNSANSNDNYHFSLVDGELTALIGNNGAGKSTLLKLLAGELPIQQGAVSTAQRSLNKDPIEYRAQVGFMPDIFPAATEFTVLTFLNFVAACYSMSQQTLEQRLKWLLSELQLLDIQHRPLTQLSLGQKQRVSLAQALINRPGVLLLDEPLNGLDPTQQAMFWRVLQSIKNECQVLLASHHLADVLAHSDRLLLIDQHAIVADINQQQCQYLLIAEQPVSPHELDGGVCIHAKIFGFSTLDEAQSAATRLNNHAVTVEPLQQALLEIFKQQSSGIWQW